MTFLVRVLWRSLCFCGLLYVSLSVVYTSAVFLFSLATSRCIVSDAKLASRPHTSVIARLERTLSSRQEQPGFVAIPVVNGSQPPLPPLTPKILGKRASPGPTFGWQSSHFTLKHGLGYYGTKVVDEKTILSKAFASSMRPSNMIPYFYRAAGSFRRDDITITTLVTSNRFEVLARLAKKYKGPLAVASSAIH